MMSAETAQQLKTTAVPVPMLGEDPAAGPRPVSLRRNFSWTFAGNLVYSACQWGMLMVLARLGTPEMVGQFALGLAITAPIIMFGNLQLRAVQATDARRDFRFGTYAALRLVTAALSIVLIGTIAIGSGYHRETALVIFVMGIAKSLESLSDSIFGLLQKHEQFKKVSLSLILKGALSLPMMAVAIYLSGRVLWGIAALAVTWLILLIFYDVPNARRVLRLESDEMRPVWNMQLIARLAWICLPLGIVTLLNSLNVNIPRYFIASIGERELGIYAALAYTHVIGTRFLMSLCNSCEPRLAKNFAEGNIHTFKRTSRRLLLVACLVGGGGVLASIVTGKTILTLLYGSEYAIYTNEFIVLMISSAVSYIAMAFRQSVTSARSFNVQVLPTGASALCIVVAAAVLVPLYGICGAAVATGVGALVELVGFWFLSRKAIAVLYQKVNTA